MAIRIIKLIRYNCAWVRSAYHMRMIDVPVGSHMELAHSAFITPKKRKTV